MMENDNVMEAIDALRMELRIMNNLKAKQMIEDAGTAQQRENIMAILKEREE